MPVDDRPSTIQDWLQRIEVVFSVLLLATIAITIAPLEPSLGEWTLWVVFLIPGLLGLAALFEVGIDVFRLLSTRSNSQSTTISRQALVGKVAVIGVLGILAGITLFLIVQTILVVTIVETHGGVMFGPILFTFTGGLLAVVVLVRSIGRQLLSKRTLGQTQDLQP